MSCNGRYECESMVIEYAQVLRMLGNGRLEASCFDGKQRLCHIRGKMRKKVWVNQGDIILIGLRPYQDDKADIILRYNADEARALKKRGALPSNTQIEDHPELDDESAFEFANDGDDSDSGPDDEDDLLYQPTNVGMLPPSDDESDEVDLDAL